MGQIYKGTLVIQTQNYASPTGDFTLLPLGNQAESADVKNDKQGYDSNGDVVTGTYDGGYAGVISTYEEMDSYLTEENVGRILKYVGEEQIDINVNSLKVGDSLTPLYFNTESHPQYTDFDWTDADGKKVDRNYRYAVPLVQVSSEEEQQDFIYALKITDESDHNKIVGFALGFSEFFPAFYAESLDESFPLSWFGNITDSGWQGDSLSYDFSTLSVTKLYQQNVWNSYMAKSEFTGGSEPKYKTNQTYIIENQSGEIKALPISE